MILNYGDQRSVVVQIQTTNKRRRKRRGKEKYKAKTPIKERIVYLLNTGRLKDYTHPKEVDPYWDTLYKQYEYLTYMEIFYKYNLKKIKDKLKKTQIQSIARDIQLIHRHKNQILRYLTNAMFIMYGSVIQSRFYGWKKYADEFTSRFNEVSLTNITNLTFDVSRTRCSVYFYQAFWLSGLSIIKEIQNKIKSEHSEEEDNRGNWKFSYRKSYEEEFEELFNSNTSEHIDRFTNLSFDDPEESHLESLKPILDDEEQKEVEEIKKVRKMKDSDCNDNCDLEDQLLIEEHPELSLVSSDNGNEEYIEEDRQQVFKSFLRELLQKIDVSLDYIYDSPQKELDKLVRFIKQKLKKGELQINSEQVEFVRNLLRTPT